MIRVMVDTRNAEVQAAVCLVLERNGLQNGQPPWANEFKLWRLVPAPSRGLFAPFIRWARNERELIGVLSFGLDRLSVTIVPSCDAMVLAVLSLAKELDDVGVPVTVEVRCLVTKATKRLLDAVAEEATG
jgi:hypothetical protein